MSSKILVLLFGLALLSWIVFISVIIINVKVKNIEEGRNSKVIDVTLRKPECKVETKEGWIKGLPNYFEGVQVCEFVGIPYASPPLAGLRFSRPTRMRSWNKTLKATSFSPDCMQSFPNWARHMMRPTTQEMSEDCLYLNIWTRSSTTQKPILFWIHGGGYQFGSGSLDETNGTVLAALEDVVVVTINYRLNAFGFLNLELEEIPGNMGLYDQAMALEWIHKNALSFGGDSSRIAVWGQGMGSISVSALLVSNLTKDLIRRAIMQTGSIFTTRPMYSRYAEVAEDFVSHAGCQSNESDTESEDPEDHQQGYSIACLRKTSVHLLTEAAFQVNEVNPTSFMFSPQEAFFNHSSPDVIREDLRSFLSHSLTDLIIGFNSDEGSLLLNSLNSDTFPDEGFAKISSLREARDFLEDLFVNRLQVPKTLITTALDSEFPVPLSDYSSSNSSDTPTHEDKNSIVKRMSDFLGNNVFVCPTILFGEEVAALDDEIVHAFHYKYRSSYNKLPSWFGTIHNEEVPIMFGYPLRYPENFTDEEKTFSRRLMNTISNFAKTG